MSGILRFVGYVLAALLTVIVLGAAGLWIRSSQTLSRRFPAEYPSVSVHSDSASVARGAHLASAVLNCTLCHGADLGGAVYMDAGPMGVVAGANLTTGRGGVGASRSDEDLVRAIRYGIGKDSTSLILMPSEVFVHITDEDLGAVLAYIRQLPPVDREVPRSRFGVLGRLMLGAGKFNILPAPKTQHLAPVAAVASAPTAQYGKYLADVSGCHGCHGYGLSGGRVAGPPDLPPASNITPTGIGNWTEEDFARALRTGKRRDGSTINPFMPIETFAGMTDEEVRALWLYLRSVPPKEFGNK
ncbi:MAG: cytochrome c [Cytophagaceae bacterium]|nr:cytochrome c [Gemmatimonadaceae bacterium]